MKNGWIETPEVQALLLTQGSTSWRKKNVIALFTPEEKHESGVWKHLSISHHKRYPHWDEILDARYEFFEDDETVMQILPPKREYVNLHENCFHLYSRLDKKAVPE